MSAYSKFMFAPILFTINSLACNLCSWYVTWPWTMLPSPDTQRKHCSNLMVIKWNISCLTAANCCGSGAHCFPTMHINLSSPPPPAAVLLFCSSRNRRQAPAHTVLPRSIFCFIFWHWYLIVKCRNPKLCILIALSGTRWKSFVTIITVIPQIN